jgi:hypothetical protein
MGNRKNIFLLIYIVKVLEIFLKVVCNVCVYVITSNSQFCNSKVLSLGCFACCIVRLRKAIYQSKIIDLFSPSKTFGIWIIISFFMFKYFFTRTFNDIYFVSTFLLTTILPFCAIGYSKSGSTHILLRIAP